MNIIFDKTCVSGAEDFEKFSKHKQPLIRVPGCCSVSTQGCYHIDFREKKNKK